MEFRILGALEVDEDGRGIALGGPKQRAVLALLLVHANEVVPRDRLIDELWGRERPDTARTALQVHVSQLRKTLGPDRIVTQTPGYMLRAAPEEVDLDRFQLLLGEGRQALAAGDAERAAELLREALSLWRGSPLADLAAVPFAERTRLRLEELRQDALEERIEAELRLGRHAALIAELEALLAEYPMRERLRGQLMLALYRSGRQAAALEAYRKGRRLLADELGLEPGEGLRRLERAILDQDPALAAAAAESRPEAADRSVPLRLVLAEDHYLVREGLRRLLETQPDLEVAAACGDLGSLLAAVDAERPNVVVTDVRMPPGGADEGIQAAERLRATNPEVGVVVLSQYATPSYVLALLEHGSAGRAYLLKERVEDVGQLVAAIRAVAEGGSVIDPKVVEALVAENARGEDSPLNQLTPRERDVLREMAEGKNNAAIAGELFLTERSVEKVIHSIFLKLGLTWETAVHKRVKAVILYLAASD